MRKVLDEEVRLLKDVPINSHVRLVDSKGRISKETYIKREYDRSEKKYQLDKCSDIWGTGRRCKGKQKVLVGFIY